jgi:hypothetical protein
MEFHVGVQKCFHMGQAGWSRVKPKILVDIQSSTKRAAFTALFVLP